MLIATKEVNLGSLHFGEPHKFDVAVTNTYDSTVKVDSLILSCSSCTVASMDTDTIEPEEKVMLHIIFTPGSTGLQKRSVDIVHRTGLVNRPALHIEFKAIVND